MKHATFANHSVSKLVEQMFAQSVASTSATMRHSILSQATVAVSSEQGRKEK